jgi:hypothetical protein
MSPQYRNTTRSSTAATAIAETIIESAMNLNPTNDVRVFQLEVFDDVLFDQSKPITRKSSYDATLSRARKLR